jgi:hypothetical protein
MAKNTTDERLTEMITLVVTPSMRAHLDHAARNMGNAPYAFPARMAISKYLAETDPLTPEHLKILTDAYLKTKSSKEGQK